MEKEKLTLRPESRIVATLGEDLIKDNYAAIIELVKNSYDADATDVDIIFIDFDNDNKAKIIVNDNGHGMSYETVIHKWMIPGTSDKVDRRLSPGGRVMLGEKGIGRLAAGKLGDELKIETTNKNNITTTIKVNWNEFKEKNYLDEVKIPISKKKTNKSHGTKLIVSDIDLTEWEPNTIADLKKELRKLLSPVSKHNEKFEIILNLNNSNIDSLTDYSGNIEPYPILDHYDYQLYGKIKPSGKGILYYQNGVDKRIPEKKIKINSSSNHEYNCGKIDLDIRVFDRDPEAIDDLIRRSSPECDDSLLGKRETRRLLNEIQGVGVYRGNFRIRPYGDPDYDWLSLDKRRVQNPSQNIGHNQISGYITIQGYSKSNLKEKSSREGLVHNKYFNQFKQMILKSLKELETRRLKFRKKVGRGRKDTGVESTLDSLFDFSKFIKTINHLKDQGQINLQSKNILLNTVEKERKEKSSELENIRETLARYERQVTLGKIMKVVMHSGRNPLGNMKGIIPRVKNWIECITKLEITFDECIFTSDEINTNLTDLYKQVDFFVDLLNRLNPLAKRKRSVKSKFDVNIIINRAYRVFQKKIEKSNIDILFELDSSNICYCSENDIFTIFTNLFDNSLYWLSTININKKYIKIKSKNDEDNLIIDFIDNGPGIKEEFIDMIFEPDFTTKPEGTGLGLSISGESVKRNNGNLKLLKYENGTLFRIELPREE